MDDDIIIIKRKRSTFTGRPSKRPSDSQLQADYRKLHTRKALAEHYGVSRQTIYRWLKALGGDQHGQA